MGESNEGRAEKESERKRVDPRQGERPCGHGGSAGREEGTDRTGQRGRVQEERRQTVDREAWGACSWSVKEIITRVMYSRCNDMQHFFVP
jgi:hypothetical protein